ncbi:ABC transporter ATP-binding protein/permease [Porticoccaceae bacterium]|nr:ABC transporter ATP-binding protein/permease [Porticoccaceae bacterium]
MKNPISDLPYYLSIFQHYLGKRIYSIFFLALIAGLADGFGILMLMPLLEGLGSDGVMAAPSSGLGLYLFNFLELFGLQSSTVAILLIITAAFLIKGVLVFVALGINAYLRGQLLQELKGKLFDSYRNMRFSYYASRDTGHFINVLNEQVNRALESFHAVTQLGSHMISSLVYLGLAFIVAWQFGVMALLVGGLLLVLFRWLNSFVRSLSRKMSDESGKFSKVIIETLHAFKYLTATNQMAHLEASVKNSIEKLTNYAVRTGVASAFTQAVREPVAVSFIMFIAIIQIVFLQEPLTPILVSIVLFYRGMNSMMQIQGYWQNTLEFIGGMEMVHDEFSRQKKHKELNGRQAVLPIAESIKFTDVSFAYDSGKGNVLTAINIEIPVCKTVAFVGESGAGKSTMVDLVTLILRPQHGLIHIDGLDGKHVDLGSWREQIGYVSQEAVIFDDTIANNISMWSRSFEDEQHCTARIRKAAAQAHLLEFIDSLPEGFETFVGDRGVRLSGGQRQRLVIAREMFREPRLLILDEATSALDSESEQAIERSINDLKGSVTVILIAHRLSTVRNVDQVYVFDKGSIVEQGDYQELKNRSNSKFSRLVELQML